MQPKSFKLVQKIQSFSRARRVNKTEDPKTATETGRENAAPASIVGEGAGASWVSWAETIAATELTTMTNTSIKALEILTCAMAENHQGIGNLEYPISQTQIIKEQAFREIGIGILRRDEWEEQYLLGKLCGVWTLREAVTACKTGGNGNGYQQRKLQDQVWTLK